MRIPKKINVTKLQKSQLTKTFKRVIIKVILKRVIIVTTLLKFLINKVTNFDIHSSHPSDIDI